MADRWQQLTQLAVSIVRSSVPVGHQVAGSVAPLEDCYRPDLSPPAATCRAQHSHFAVALAEAGVDLLLCETFPHPGESLIAVEEALRTGLPVWLSLTLGPSGDLMEEAVLLQTARRAADLGVEVVLVNCSPVDSISALLPKLSRLGLRTGGYGNVGRPDPEKGWLASGDASAEAYAQAGCRWVEAGAEVVGGCCGTGPEHIRALAAALRT